MRAFITRAITVAVALLVVSGTADAGWVTGFSGSNQFTRNVANGSPSPNGDAVVNFAVYDNHDSSFSALVPGGMVTQFGAGTGAFIYLYQIVNTNPVPGEGLINSLFLEVPRGRIASAGTITDRVFTDTSGSVGLAGNVRLGAESNVNDTVLPYGPDPGIGTQASAVGATSVSYDPFANLLQFNFPAGTLAPNAFSSLVFATSDQAPTFGSGRLGPSDTTRGALPIPTPEPASIVLCVSALPILGLLRYIRRWKGGAVVK